MAMEDCNDNKNYYEDSEDALSFCDLPNMDETELDDADVVVLAKTTCPAENDPSFEFVNPDAEADFFAATETVVFCGEIIPPKQKNEFLRHPRNGLFIRRESFKRSHSFRTDGVSAKPAVQTTINRSSTVRFGRSKALLPATGNSSRKHKVLLGLVKLQPKMELSDIRKRQNRRPTPVTMFPVKDSGEPVGPGDGVGGRSTHHRGIFGPLRCRAHLVSALTKASFGCIPHNHV